MSARRRLCAAASLIVALLSPASPGAQEPALDEVLGRAAAYVAGFQRQLSEIVAEETYVQRIANTSRFADTRMATPQRTLRSDLILVPVEMRESYVKYGERISGHAAYGKFRLLKQ